jgi:cytochrome c-type biogenesis protein
MNVTVTDSGALIAGLLFFVSPSVWPLVPPYLCYLVAVGLEALAGEPDKAGARHRVFFSALAVVLGFTTVFVALGVTANSFGRFFREFGEYQFVLPFVVKNGAPVEFSLLAIVPGIVIILIGLYFLGVFRIVFPNRQARMQVRGSAARSLGLYVVGLALSYTVGLAFALGWTPSIAPYYRPRGRRLPTPPASRQPPPAPSSSNPLLPHSPPTIPQPRGSRPPLLPLRRVCYLSPYDSR